MLKLMYITNDEKIAKIAELSGVDRIFVDLEMLGKIDRQGHLNTVISEHKIEDVKKIKEVLSTSKLLVRINPINDNSKEEIDRVIEYGADIIMLPYFKTKKEVEMFINYVNNRADVCLLFETSDAVENIDGILSLDGIDEIHIGLNDLHLCYDMKFMFELLSNGTVEKLCNKFKSKGITYGFGGIARIGYGMLPAENIITEHYRLKSEMVILSRSFCNLKEINNIDEISNIFKKEIQNIRVFEKKVEEFDEHTYLRNKELVSSIVENIVSN